MGGYQLMVSADIFRGRYRESLEHAAPITPGEPLLYRFALPTANHVFLPASSIAVQVQSSWFPLYDRNPQTFVPSIFWARPEDYRKAVQRIYHAPGLESFIELPLVVVVPTDESAVASRLERVPSDWRHRSTGSCRWCQNWMSTEGWLGFRRRMSGWSERHRTPKTGTHLDGEKPGGKRSAQRDCASTLRRSPWLPPVEFITFQHSRPCLSPFSGPPRGF
jgi:hypothetical protein